MVTVTDQLGESTVSSVKTKVQEPVVEQHDSLAVSKAKTRAWGKTTGIALIVLAADIACLWYSKESLAFVIGSLGIVTFFGILILSSHYKKQTGEDVGAVRQALAGSLFVVYFAILGISLERPDVVANSGTVLKSITDNYWVIILSVVAFYFGSQGAQSVAKALKPSS